MTTIFFSSTGLQINATDITFPLTINTLETCLDANYRTIKKKSNTIFTWDELGILAYSKNGNQIESFTLQFNLEHYDFIPQNIFTGIFQFNNQDGIEYYRSHKSQRVRLYDGDESGALISNEISASFLTDDDIVTAVEISAYIPYVRWEGIPKDKYKIKSVEEETIVFTDLGFKLSIIEELMYNKELLQPKFDIYEFAKWYRNREIDIDEEGYGPIKEVVAYFKELPIPKRFAPEVTEIYQDGGNDIYVNLSPFAGGGEEDWDIESAIDAKQFPNLKKATLCHAKETVYDELIAMGIDAEWL